MSRAITIVWLACAMTACGKPSTVGASPTAGDLQSMLPDHDPALAKRLVEQEGALALDVRSREEYDQGHLDGALQIPHDQLAQRLDEVLERQGGDKSKPIVVYCRSGRRSALAKDVLIAAGFRRVTNLGGYEDWPSD